MYVRALAAGLVAALQLSGVPAAMAADLYPPYGRPYAVAPDEDPRYADVYRHPPPRPRYTEADPYPPYGSRAHDDEEEWRSDYPPWAPRKWADRGDYLAPMPPPYRFDRYAYGGHESPGCLPRHELRRELLRDGWSDFHDLELRDNIAIVKARRPDGQMYRLRIDRCTGQIVRARPVDDYADTYAWRRRDRPMY